MEVVRHWRLKDRYNLTGSVCTECKTPQFPSRVVCTVCIENKKGEIYNSNPKIEVPIEVEKENK